MNVSFRDVERIATFYRAELKIALKNAGLKIRTDPNDKSAHDFSQLETTGVIRYDNLHSWYTRRELRSPYLVNTRKIHWQSNHKPEEEFVGLCRGEPPRIEIAFVTGDKKAEIDDDLYYEIYRVFWNIMVHLGIDGTLCINARICSIDPFLGEQDTATVVVEKEREHENRGR